MIYELKISTYRGVSFNAEHYYGNIRYHIRRPQEIERDGKIFLSFKSRDIEHVDLTRELDDQEAAYLQKKDGDISCWDIDRTTIRFNSKDDVRQAAIAWFAANKHEDDAVLVEQTNSGQYNVLAGDMVLPDGRNARYEAVEKFRYPRQKIV